MSKCNKNLRKKIVNNVIIYIQTLTLHYINSILDKNKKMGDDINEKKIKPLINGNAYYT